MKTLINTFCNGEYKTNCTIDSNNHVLKLEITHESSGNRISFSSEDKIINLPSARQENIQKQGTYWIFHDKTQLLINDYVNKYSESCSSIIRINSCPIDTNTGEPIPGLIVCYKLYLMRNLPAIYITTSFLSNDHVFCGNLQWMNLIPEETRYEEFYGVGPYMHGSISELEHPIAFREGINLVGDDCWFGLRESGQVMLDPNTCSLIPDYELRNFNSDLRILNAERPLSVWLLFGSICPNDSYSHKNYQALCNSLPEIIPEAKKSSSTIESKEMYSLKAGFMEVVLEKGRTGIFLSRINNYGNNYDSTNCDTNNNTANLFLSKKVLPLFEVDILELDTKQRYWIDSDNGWENTIVEKESEGISLKFINPGDGKLKDFAVVLKARAIAKEHRIEWTMDVLNDNPNISVMSVTYPNVSFEGENLDAFIPANPGEVINDACSYSRHLYGSYPSGFYYVMPYFAIYNNKNNQNNGIYVAVHDDVGSRKDITFNTFRSSKQGMLSYNYPAVNRGEPANAFSLPGCMVWQIFSGDWFDATQIYKRFVHTQAKWMPKVSKEGREDTPLWMREMSFWIMDWMPNDNPDADPIPISVRPEKEESDRESWYKTPILLKKELGVPVGYHVYNWHWIPFNNDYPHYFPTKEGFETGIKAMQAEGIYIMPYINGRLWDILDRRDQDYQFSNIALPWATKKADGELYLETYAAHESDGSLVQLAAMCPSSYLWKKVMGNTAKQLFQKYNVNAIYIDQVAAAGANLCMDKNHNHLPGGGSWWIDAYWNFMNRLNIEKPKDCAYTTECNAEVYAKSFDGYLTWVWIHPNQVPAFSSIYGSYIVMFGRNINGYKKKDIPYFKFHISQQILYGQQIGWLNSDIVYHKEKLDYLKKMVKLRWDYREFFYKGSMLRPPKIIGDVPRIITIAGMRYPGVFDAPVVSAGAWKLWDGTRTVLFLFNTSEQAITWTCEFNAAEYSVTNIESMHIVSGNGHILERYQDSGSLVRLKCLVDKSDYLAIEW
ncbi:MAG: hypothetical protein HPY74_08765 [Firmicutes bacterium]|nr:hypothetical protein [Bacillota bacterium]